MANETLGGTTGERSGGTTKAGQTAETLREKGHDIAGAAKESVSAVAEKAEAADEIARRAQDYIADAERRLDAFIDATEQLFAKGSRYTGVAKAWIDDHREYRDKAEALMQKAAEFRTRVQSKVRETGEAASEQGEQIAGSARSRFSDLSSRGMQRVRSGAGSASAFVRENPMDSLLIGAAVGVLIGTAYKHMSAETFETVGPVEGGTYGEL